MLVASSAGTITALIAELWQGARRPLAGAGADDGERVGDQIDLRAAAACR